MPARVPVHVRLGLTLLMLPFVVAAGWGAFMVFIEVWPWKNGTLLFVGIVFTFAFGSLRLRDHLLRWYSGSTPVEEQTDE